MNAPIYMGEQLAVDVSVDGPAIVELPMTTIVVYPGWSLSVQSGDYFLNRDR